MKPKSVDLPAATGAHENEELPLGDAEREIGDHSDCAEAFCEILMSRIAMGSALHRSREDLFTKAR